MGSRGREDIATDVLNALMRAYGEDSIVISTDDIKVTSKDLIYMCSEHITTCPDCGAEFPVNIDCDLCSVVAEINAEYLITEE